MLEVLCFHRLHKGPICHKLARARGHVVLLTRCEEASLLYMCVFFDGVYLVFAGLSRDMRQTVIQITSAHLSDWFIGVACQLTHHHVVV